MQKKLKSCGPAWDVIVFAPLKSIQMYFADGIGKVYTNAAYSTAISKLNLFCENRKLSGTPNQLMRVFPQGNQQYMANDPVATNAYHI